ncbi:Hypothetical protein FKW44_013287 [Caligus rogercresseyi]|uniref:Uncharacterized protein n=1 Tax=Caligus rogercresseyi TaxID=217165 RepID=A0A7T8HL87_CALRO|nr:Hypothetical protein FKW44_013287 [Caligus rogercresseyi]
MDFSQTCAIIKHIRPISQTIAPSLIHQKCSYKQHWHLNTTLLEDTTVDDTIQNIIRDKISKLMKSPKNSTSFTLKLILDASKKEYIKLGAKLSEERKIKLEQLSRGRDNGSNGVQENQELDRIIDIISNGHLIRTGFRSIPKEQILLGRIKNMEKVVGQNKKA